MCGRYSLTRKPPQVALPDFVPQYNIAPTELAPVIRTPGKAEYLAWGFSRAWNVERGPSAVFSHVAEANSDKPNRRPGACSSSPLINARVETVAGKRTFARAFHEQRCLVLADGFYEWERKQPWRIFLKSGEPFTFAAIWDTLEKDTACFCILTTRANSLLEGIHDRMPVILPAEQHAAWLDGKRSFDPAAIAEPFPSRALQRVRVNPRMNRADYKAPDCLDPVLPVQPELF